jgi:hypothetical protein
MPRESLSVDRNASLKARGPRAVMDREPSGSPPSKRRRARVMFRLLVLLLMLVSETLAVARAEPRAGMFVAWAQRPDKTDLGGRETNLRSWEERLGLERSALVALDFYGEDKWESMISMQWLPGYWARRNEGRKLVWSIRLTATGTPLTHVAEGLHDFEFGVAARAIAAAQPDAIIRIGWEMNGDWYPWSAIGREADYVAAYRRVAHVFRAVSPRFSFDWCVGGAIDYMPAERAYPGDDVVDLIGMDMYDTPSEKPAAAHWREDVLERPYGLRWLEAFSAAHGKRMSLGEWGVGLRGARDNPYFIDRMADWLRANSARIAHHIYFDVPPHDLDSEAFPASRARFLAQFSAASVSSSRAHELRGPLRHD